MYVLLLCKSHVILQERFCQHDNVEPTFTHCKIQRDYAILFLIVSPHMDTCRQLDLTLHAQMWCDYNQFQAVGKDACGKQVPAIASACMPGKKCSLIK